MYPAKGFFFSPSFFSFYPSLSSLHPSVSSFYVSVCFFPPIRPSFFFFFRCPSVYSFYFFPATLESIHQFNEIKISTCQLQLKQHSTGFTKETLKQANLQQSNKSLNRPTHSFPYVILTPRPSSTHRANANRRTTSRNNHPARPPPTARTPPMRTKTAHITISKHPNSRIDTSPTTHRPQLYRKVSLPTPIIITMVETVVLSPVNRRAACFCAKVAC